MRVLVLVVSGLIIACMAPQRPTAAPLAPPAPYYVDGQPSMSNPSPPEEAGSGPAEKTARDAHRAALEGVYAAFGHPWPPMCTAERRTALVAALNAYYADRFRFERRGGWFRPDQWKDTAFDWQTLDDKAVERLTRLGFAHRYFVMSELDPRVANAVAELVRGTLGQPQCDEEFKLWTTGLEGYLQGSRESYRAEALAMAPWARSCQPGARKLLIGHVNRYYQERVEQQTHLMQWGTLGLRRASALFDTKDDRALDDLARLMLREGYLSLDDIRKDARPLVASLFDGVAGAARCPEHAARVK
ncbi:MAG: hypothetical protein E6G97_00855 [Alphaproteobacteria bacterium]|nr:MAG: hypothetical protein E6G97_00855 [Alphaproteobacteria bacterium]